MDLQDVLPTDIDWWQLLFALLVAVSTWIVSRFARRGTTALLRRAPGISAAVGTAIAQFVGYAILLLGFGIALAMLGANVQPLLAIVVILAVVAVLVLRGVADNFAAGVLLQARQTVRIGDEVVVEALDSVIAGTVTELNARAVILHTADGRALHIPNARLLSEPVVNDSTHGARRSEVQVRVRRDGSTGIDEVIAPLVAAASTAEGVRRHEAVRALVVGVSEDRLIARLQFWHHPLHGAVVSAAVVVAVFDALRALGTTGTVTSVPGPPALVPSDPV
ncbi:mechanosensitive ion channel domain-containing protein [Microbacterium sp. 1S1]|uniref:mechanosensitive ion channel domain-containing protein n=1 Tax=Microbacterium sp. 1S1 TaxID=2606451 RepID=UPI0011EAE1DF|nr:mechanosensitive ion channel domain-containing protein [Microbacterium sp. 1S1]